MKSVKKRLTITLDRETIARVDAFIDGAKIRNRSHAIEYLLNTSFSPSATKVLILAGGEGVKFRPLTNELPKSLIPVGKKPLLEHTVDSLREHGLKKIYISLGHLGAKIKEYFGDGKESGVSIRYLKQSSKKKGTAQPVLEAKKRLSEGAFIVVYGDVITDLDYTDLLEFHKSHRGIATLALTSVEKPAMWGVATIQGSRIVSFIEKPNAKTKSHLINAGVYVCNPEIFKYIKSSSTRLEKDVFPRLAEEGKLYAYTFEADWYDVSGPEAYRQVLSEWRR